MTEFDWLTCTDPMLMLRFLRGKGRVRKLRLFAVACCRRAWECYWGAEEPLDMHPAVLASEAFADGLIGKDRLRYERSQIGGVGSYSAKAYIGSAMSAVVNDSAIQAAEGAATCAAYCLALLGMGDRLESPDSKGRLADLMLAERRVQASLLRDVFGGASWPVGINSVWHTPMVLELAQSIYEDRVFERMPVLGDALEKAGCDNADLVNHCRSESPHVRGCWVVDLLLGKS